MNLVWWAAKRIALSKLFSKLYAKFKARIFGNTAS